jgi:hypothetical protein
MMHLIRIFAVLSLLIVLASSVLAQEGFARTPIPLPDPTPEQRSISGWPDDRQLSNSVRAWHYNPYMVQPLSELGNAIDKCSLSLFTSRMLIAVVASRNHCIY